MSISLHARRWRRATTTLTPLPTALLPKSRLLPRLFVLALLSLAAGIGLAGPAAAHNVLISSDPSDGAVVQTAPTVVTLTFDAAGRDFQPVVTVLGPDGQKYESGAPQVDSTVVTTPVGPMPTAGDYVIAYRVVSADGHPVQGEVRFRLAAPAPTTSSPATASSAPASSARASSAPASSSSGLSGWAWAAIAVVAALIVAAAVVVVRRRGSGADSAGGSSNTR
jgi:methionine-rich copper-binding protein CopC